MSGKRQGRSTRRIHVVHIRSKPPDPHSDTGYTTEEFRYYVDTYEQAKQLIAMVSRLDPYVFWTRIQRKRVRLSELTTVTARTVAERLTE